MEVIIGGNKRELRNAKLKVTAFSDHAHERYYGIIVEGSGVNLTVYCEPEFLARLRAEITRAIGEAKSLLEVNAEQGL